MSAIHSSKKNILMRSFGIVAGSLFFGAVISFGLHTLAQYVQYPNGVLYQAGVPNILSGSGNPGWQQNAFSCSAGKTLRAYHYDCNCSNNATWYICVDSTLNPNPAPPPPVAPDEPSLDFVPAVGDREYYTSRGTNFLEQIP